MQARAPTRLPGISMTPPPADCPNAASIYPSISTGKERDPESGNDYFGARYYASTMGRFLTADEVRNDAHLGNPQSWNLYTYVRNNPLALIDPTGEAGYDAVAAAEAAEQQVEQQNTAMDQATSEYASNIGALALDEIAASQKESKRPEFPS